jgi:hypothetical protein
MMVLDATSDSDKGERPTRPKRSPDFLSEMAESSMRHEPSFLKEVSELTFSKDPREEVYRTRR